MDVDILLQMTGFFNKQTKQNSDTMLNVSF